MNKFLSCLLFLSLPSQAFSNCDVSNRFTLVVHGGVGYNSSDAQKNVLKKILSIGHDLLKDGATSQDVVQLAVEEMENSGLFNSGKGGTRTSLGTVELDAAIMEGTTLSAGAVAGVKDVKNPIRLARLIKDKTKHVFVVSDGASALARSHNLDMVTPDYYVGKAPGDKLHFGTVGAVALDRCGHVASATSTGGLYGKLPGRVGDSPIIGAGTYANDKTCAVSATGEGEKFIRANAGVRISNILEYANRTLSSAVNESLSLVESLGGGGGIISVSKNGDVVWATTHQMPMPRGYVKEDGVVIQLDSET